MVLWVIISTLALDSLSKWRKEILETKETKGFLFSIYQEISLLHWSRRIIFTCAHILNKITLTVDYCYFLAASALLSYHHLSSLALQTQWQQGWIEWTVGQRTRFFLLLFVCLCIFTGTMLPVKPLSLWPFIIHLWLYCQTLKHADSLRPLTLASSNTC